MSCCIPFCGGHDGRPQTQMLTTAVCSGSFCDLGEHPSSHLSGFWRQSCQTHGSPQGAHCFPRTSPPTSLLLRTRPDNPGQSPKSVSLTPSRLQKVPVPSQARCPEGLGIILWASPGGLEPTGHECVSYLKYSCLESSMDRGVFGLQSTGWTRVSY